MIWSQSRGGGELTKGGTECRLHEEGISLSCRSDLIVRRECLTAYAPSLTAPPGHTYPATYKVCTGSASCGRPNPHTGLRELAPHRCLASARLAWFPDGYRISIFPYRSVLRPNPASRALPASILGLPDSGGGTTGSRRADALRHYG